MSDMPFVRPDVRAFLDYLNRAPGPKVHQMDVPAARAMSRTMRNLAEVPRGPIAVARDLVMPGPAGDMPLRLYDARADRAPGLVMAFFHGGGFVLGDIESHDPLCAAIARALDIPVVSVGYRLSPEHPWPAAPDDCEAAARWIAAGNLADAPATGLVLAGDSAGGNLAIVTALALRDSPAKVPVLAQWALYSVPDLLTRHPSYYALGEGHFLTRQGLDWFGDHYRADAGHWRASPILADQRNMPPSLIVTASLDPLRDQGRAYAAKLIEAGVPTIFREAMGNIHGFVTMRRALPSSETDLQGMLAALKLMIAEATGNEK